MGDEFFHADGQTDMTKLIVAFRNFPNAPKNSSFKWEHTNTMEKFVLISELLRELV